MRDIGDQKKRQPHGRGDQTNHQVKDHHHSQMHRVHTGSHERLGNDGCDHKDSRGTVEEHAHHQQQHVDQQEQHQGVGRNGEHDLSHGLGNLLDRQHPSEQGGHGDDEQNGGGGAQSLQRRVKKALPGQFTVEQSADQQRVGNGDRCNLGRGKPASEHACNEYDWGHQGRQGRQKIGPQPSPTGPGVSAGVAPFDRQPGGHDHQGGHAEEPGQDAAEQQLDHRYTGDGAVENERNAGREDGTHHGRSRSNGAGKGGLEAFCLHGIDLDAPDTANIGQCRARHTGKHQAAKNIDLRQAARQPAHGCIRKTINHL